MGGFAIINLGWRNCALKIKYHINLGWRNCALKIKYHRGSSSLHNNPQQWGLRIETIFDILMQHLFFDNNPQQWGLRIETTIHGYRFIINT